MKVTPTKIIIEPCTYIMLAVWILLLPWTWIGAMTAAAAVHEAGHLAVIRLSGGVIHRIRIGPFGARIEADFFSPGQEFLSALAGPGAGLILGALFSFFPRAAACAWIQSIFNLLPIYPLDGARAIRAWRDLRQLRKIGCKRGFFGVQ